MARRTRERERERETAEGRGIAMGMIVRESGNWGEPMLFYLCFTGPGICQRG